MSFKKLTRREFLVMSATGIAGLGLVACAPAVTPTAASATSVPATKPPAAVATAIPTQGATATSVPTAVLGSNKESPMLIPNTTGLTIEENQIVLDHQLDSLRFTPLHSSWQEVRDRHAEQMQPVYQIPFNIINGNDVLSPMNGVQGYQAIVSYANGNAAQAILQVKQGKNVVFHLDGLVFVNTAIPQALWVDGSYWTLEIASLTNMQSAISGQVFRDGVLLNDQYGYQEMFNYRLLNGKPMYFYQKDGKIHLSYDGTDLPLVYDEVPHYGCCSNGELNNPSSGPNWLTFWGLRAGTLYYVQIGRYD